MTKLSVRFCRYNNPNDYWWITFYDDESPVEVWEHERWVHPPGVVCKAAVAAEEPFIRLLTGLTAEEMRDDMLATYEVKRKGDDGVLFEKNEVLLLNRVLRYGFYEKAPTRVSGDPNEAIKEISKPVSGDISKWDLSDYIPQHCNSAAEHIERLNANRHRTGVPLEFIVSDAMIYLLERAAKEDKNP